MLSLPRMIIRVLYQVVGRIPNSQFQPTEMFFALPTVVQGPGIVVKHMGFRPLQWYGAET